MTGFEPTTSPSQAERSSQIEPHSNNQLFSSQGCHPKMLIPHLSLAFYPQQGFCISNLACASLVLQRGLSLKRISSH